MADYDFETLDDWIAGGSHNNTNFSEVKDDPGVDMASMYDNYKTEVQRLINEGKLAHAEATVTAHGRTWNLEESDTDDDDTDDDDDDDTITYDPPVKTETPAPPVRGGYEGPEYYDPRTYDPTPWYMDRREVSDDELVSHRMAVFLDSNNPILRAAQEALARRMAAQGRGRYDARTRAGMGAELIKASKEIGALEAAMFATDRNLHNAAWYKQMDIRMDGALKQAATHISGQYGLTVAKWQDITNQWKAQLAADLQAYGIDVGAAVSVYTTKVQEALGLKGLDVKMADIMSNIEDNAEAASFIWDWIYGDNDLNPSDYHKWWKEKYGDEADDDDTTTTTDINATWINGITSRLNAGNCAAAKQMAENTGNEAHYNNIVEADGYTGRCKKI